MTEDPQTFPEFFAAFWHLYLVGSAYAATVVAFGGILFILIVLATGKGSLKQRIKERLGSGT